MTKRHGWFEIPGVQSGERDLEERVAPLRPLMARIKGATILDLGCAEGLISAYLCEVGGARLAHGIDKHGPWLETAIELHRSRVRPKFKVKYDQCDLDHFDEAVIPFLPSYDVVLALNVIQKLQKPREFLLTVAHMASKFFVYSGPDAVLVDRRSDHVPVDIEHELGPLGFKLWHFDHGRKDRRKGHLGVRMIFAR